jgi:AcrR family transcriptional regulator
MDGWQRQGMPASSRSDGIMSEKQKDRRIARSRTALLAAFIEMMLRDGYDTLTVEAVAERANVGRSTFYVHFRSKEDILRQCLANTSRELARALDASITSEQFAPLLQHYYEQRRINHVFLVAPVRAIWVRSLADEIEPMLAARASEQALLPLRLIALHLAEIEIGLVAQWLLARAPIKPERIAEALLATTRAAAAALLAE